jgi:Uma2 family endonuclease
MGLALRDTELHTYSEYCRWPEGVRYELIGGEAYAMAPAPSPRHQEWVGGIFRQVADALEGKLCKVYLAPFDVRLPRGAEADDDIDTVVQPDLSVICDSSKIDERGCRGAPDWVIEVLSPSTAGHDMIVKRDLYERHGVREYWIVHPTDRVVTVYTLSDGAYGKPDVYELVGEVASKALPEVVIDWARMRFEP